MRDCCVAPHLELRDSELRDSHCQRGAQTEKSLETNLDPRPIGDAICESSRVRRVGRDLDYAP